MDPSNNAQKPRTLQELIAGNALIDAFMGGGKSVPRQQHPEARVEALLASIETCSDIEKLVCGAETDVQALSDQDQKDPADNEDVSLKEEPENHNQMDTLAARLARIKSLMYNERTTAPSFPQSLLSPLSQHKTIACALLHSLLMSDDRKMLFPKLLGDLHRLPFEARKDVASIFNYLLVCGCVNLGEGASGNSNDAIAISYTKTMIAFVQYVDEYYQQIMGPIVQGHYVNVNMNVNANAAPVANIDGKQNESEKQESGQTRSNNTSEEASKAKVTSVQQPVKTIDVVLHCGAMFRSTLRHPKLYENLVQPSNTASFIYPFLDLFVNQPNFEVASDALETLRLIMHPEGSGVSIPSVPISSASAAIPSSTSSQPQPQTESNPELLEAMMEATAAAFLEREYESIFVERFNVKLLSAQHANYITRRVSLQILSTILLTRTNYNVMMLYISNRTNLKTIMMLLRDSSAHITLEAFNVFKIFVANPNKPVEVVRILADNKVKLVKYLAGLHHEKEATDEQFKDEKALVISTLEQME